jgi:hypothetical protein
MSDSDHPDTSIDPALIAVYRRQQADRTRAEAASAEIIKILRASRCTIQVQVILDSAAGMRSVWRVDPLPEDV